MAVQRPGDLHGTKEMADPEYVLTVEHHSHGISQRTLTQRRKGAKRMQG
jgi:hypothetical protein